jgi:hypothetical protein
MMTAPTSPHTQSGHECRGVRIEQDNSNEFSEKAIKRLDYDR